MRARGITTVILAAILLLGQPARAEDPVYFADANLKQAVIDALLALDPPIVTTDPTPTDMLSLSEFTVEGIGITDLTGLEYAHNVSRLRIRSNPLVSIAPLAGLTNLTELGIDWNVQLSDISALASMIHLQRLSLVHCAVSDITPLAGLTSLEFIEIYANQISNVSPLSGLVNLIELQLPLNQITDIGSLSGLTNLTKLVLHSNSIESIAAVAGMHNLTTLLLEGGHITDVSPLAGLTSLTELTLGVNEITDITPLAGLINLTMLRINQNAVRDIAPLLELTHLTTLDLWYNPLDWQACCLHIPVIQQNNPALYVAVDPNPYDCGHEPTFTPVGANVTISPMDNTTGTTPITLVFGQVTASGGTILATAATGPELPSRYIRADPPMYFSLTTSALYAGPVDVYVSYAGINLPGPSEFLRLLHHENGQWVECAVTINTVNQTIWGATGSLGLFAVVAARVPPGPDEPVYFADANLKQAVMAALGTSTDPTPNQMLNLTTLTATNRGIADLLGLEYAVNLTELNLLGNNICDLNPLAGLTALTTLSLQWNQIEDIHALSGLTNLTYLGLGTNHIGDISPLSALTNLLTLRLEWNTGISDISAVSSMSKLDMLDISRTWVSDLSPLAGLTNLRLLFATGDHIGDVSALSGLTGLEYLGLDDNGIGDISPLSGLTQLTGLGLADNVVLSDLRPLATLTNLTTLHLSTNQISDISPLSGLVNLTTLELRENRIVGLTPLATLTNLISLDLGWNLQITNISALGDLTNLGSLHIEGNLIQDISPLGALTHLWALYLEANQITDIAALADLTNLEWLHLAGNQVTDISPLLGMTKLRELEVYGNPLNQNAYCLHMPIVTLRNPSVTINADPNPYTCEPEQPVFFVDAGLKQAVMDALGISVDPTPTHMLALRTLHAETRGITDLTGLELASDLRELFLSSNQISTLAPLSGLTLLSRLDLGSNQIHEIAALAGFTNLQDLTLSGNPLYWDAYCVHLPTIITNNPSTAIRVDPNPYNCSYEPTPTPQGTAVIINPVDTTTGTMPALITFEQVVQSGGTILASSATGPRTPAGYGLGNPPTYYHLTSTASYTGLIDVCVSYAGISFNGPPESLHLMRYENGQWIDCTTVVNTNNQTVCGVMNSLQPLAIMLEEEPVLFADANLKQAVKNALGLSTDPTPGDMLALRGLDAPSRGITNLIGLEYALNLGTLRLSANQISDLAPLANLTQLEYLQLDNNRITSVAPLAALASLAELYLQQNQITEVSGLANLTYLWRLMLDRNQIVDISGLSGLTQLAVLTLYQNQISDISALAGMTQLSSLPLYNNRISDLSPLAGLANLRTLQLSSNQIASLGALTNLINLQNLQLNGNQISDLDPLANLINLQTLQLNKNQIAGIGALAGLANLRTLYLDNNQVSDIGALSNLTRLTDLRAQQNQIGSISALAGKTGLRTVYLNTNRISDLSPLSASTGLTDLRLHSNQITSIDVLAGMMNLRYLFLSDNDIGSISVLAGMVNLRELRLDGNQINSISALSNMPYLTALRLQYNQISDMSPVANLTALRTLDLGANPITAVPALPNLSSLTYLGLYNCAVNSVSDLSGLTSLQQLDLNNNQVTNVGGLASLTSLKTLHLEVNAIADVTPLAGLTSLDLLYVYRNQLTDASALAALTNLKSLALSWNQITDFSWLSNLPGLTLLSVEGNPISDISFLQNLTALQTLWAGNDQVADITPLAALTQLRQLYLEGAQISDISALTSLTSLSELRLNDDPLSAEAYCTDLPVILANNPGLTLTVDPNPYNCQPEGHILFEYFWGTDHTLGSLLALPIFPDSPSQSESRWSFEGPTNWRYYYGTRARGYVSPPATGDYTFWIASDDQSQLWLSTDENPANAVQIASVQGWTPPRDFDNTGGGVGGPEQRSSPIPLEAGKRYYIEALCAQGTGGDNLAVAWQGPSIPTRRVISGTFLSAWTGDSADSDGVPSLVEDGAPNGGDGNADSVPDSQQDHVVSLPNAVDGQYVTLVSPEGTEVQNTTAIGNPSPADAPPGVEFPVGFFDFALSGMAVGGSATVTIILPAGQTVETYYKYGPTPDNPSPHWYEFLYDGTTGAEILSGQVILHLVDGLRGDDDLSANGVIVEPGGPSMRLHSLTADFNGTAIPAGRTVWFNSVITPHGLPGTAVTFRFTNGRIQSADGSISVQVPDALLTYDPAATCAETHFINGRWVTRVPASGLSGNTWLSGVGLLSPELPGGIKDVTWSGSFLCDTPGVTLQWKWAAAVYTSFPGELESLGVKSVDGDRDCSHSNSDHAGTPEMIKSYVTGGARGGGGSNYTGGYSGTLAVTPYFGN